MEVFHAEGQIGCMGGTLLVCDSWGPVESKNAAK